MTAKNKKTAFIALLVISVVGVALLAFFASKPKQTTPSTPNIMISPEGVTISTDKNVYSKGEIINIAVKNGLGRSIWYYGGADRVWGIEYFQDGRWVNPVYEESGGFQLTEKKVGDACYVVLYERMHPSELKPNAALTGQWNQKICPFEPRNPSEPRTVRYMASGKYRLTFHYGLGISDSDPLQITEAKTAHSSAFTIK